MSDFTKSFLKSRLRTTAYLLVIQVLIYGTLLLSGVNKSQILYPAYLTFFAYVVFMVSDYLKQRKKYFDLEQVINHAEVTLEDMPPFEDVTEEKYQELIIKLHQICREQENQVNDSRKEMLEFVTLWTHQVKTPLTASLLLSQELDGEHRELIESRLYEIQQYCDVILQYLRVEGEGTDYAFEKCEARSIVNQAVKYFARIFISKGLSVKVDVPEKVFLVTDEKWLVFALQQIISNALKYTEKGTITIDMPTPESIRVSDTGVGICEEDIPRIFERGYTGFNGRKDKKATGIGLFLVKNIMEKMGGSVEVESEKDKGTSVTLNLTKL